MYMFFSFFNVWRWVNMHIFSVFFNDIVKAYVDSCSHKSKLCIITI